MEGIVKEVNNDFECLDDESEPPAILKGEVHVEIDLDPRMLETKETMGAAGDILSILVDAADPSRELKIGL